MFTRIFVILALPLVILTLGLFYFVINAFLLWITAMLIEGFEVKGFFNTIIAALLISFIDTVLHWAIPWKPSKRSLQLLC
jgi:putative membrane protein